MIMKKKINIQFIIVASFAAVFTAIAAMILFYNIFKNQVYDDIKDYTHVIQAFPQGFLEKEENIIRLKEDGLRITLIQKDGSVAFDSSANQKEMENHKDRPEFKEALEKGEGATVRWSVTSSLHTFYYAKRLENGDILRVGKDSENISKILKNMALLILLVSLFIIGFCGMLSRCLVKNLLSPIEKLASHPDDVSLEQMELENYRFSKSGWPWVQSKEKHRKMGVYREIEPFIQTIREQHMNILNYVKMRQEFTANVSHELKTPLTAISGYAELIESGMADEADIKRFASEIHVSANRLLDLINDILKLSELDDKEQEFDLVPVDLYKAARGCLDMMEVQAAKQDIRLYLMGKSCTIAANRNLIDELLYNLCSNGIRYNNQGGTVTVTAMPVNDKVMLSVKDTGIGIPKEYQERIFERFYRVDKGRSRQNGGTGLGLAIVKHIVAQHHAEIMLESEPGKGTEVKVLFPQAMSQSAALARIFDSYENFQLPIERMTAELPDQRAGELNCEKGGISC